MPVSAASSSSVVCPEMRADTSVPIFAVSSSLMAVKSLAPVRSGALLTGLTVMLALAVALLKAVVPPFVDVLATPVADPIVWSQARNVKPLFTVPFQFAAGTNRTREVASAARRRADEFDGLPNDVQLDPPLVLYCQLPCELSTPVTAMPEREPISTSLT